jgi:hypothetical protein
MDHATFMHLLMNQSKWANEYNYQKDEDRKQYNRNAVIKNKQKLNWKRLLKQIESYNQQKN